jgi:hypothetical protein
VNDFIAQQINPGPFHFELTAVAFSEARPHGFVILTKEGSARGGLLVGLKL